MLKFTSWFVNKPSDWLIFVQGPIRGFVYKLACEFQYERMNFTTKFGMKYTIFREKLCEINCKIDVYGRLPTAKLAIYLSNICRTFKCDLQMCSSNVIKCQFKCL